MIRIVQGDITTLEVDAIVNAANQVMLGGGGVDGAIHRAAGPELFEACLKVPEVRPGVRCPTGEARITPGFRLPAKFVIHTVGPVYRDGLHGEPDKLAACYRNSLALAAENACRSIAFPCISTGVYGYPIEDAAKIAIDTVRIFLSGRDSALPETEVVICCFSERDKTVYENLKGIPNMDELKTLITILNDAAENKLRLFIPSYQRGYRWSSREILELLSDIDATSTDNYFLQLLAVREDDEHKQLRIIDGQQRLTTALLILDCIEEDKHLVDGIKYETRDQNGGLDKHFRDKAKNTIQTWLDKKADDEKKRFLRKVHNCKFLYFPIFDKALEFDFFSRLNTWKISATDSELVKCFFLSDMGDTDPVDNDEINKRAILWNQMERQLSDDQFWGVFANSAEVENDRMGFLLSSVPKIAEIAIDKKERFPLFKACKDLCMKKSELWSDIVKTFDLMRKWYGDKRSRHLVGWYLHRKGSSAHRISKNLIEEATQSTQELVKDKDWLDSPILYYNGGDRLHNFLLLANVAWCSEKLGVDYDFFRHAKIGEWSIEHVHARNQRKLGEVEFKGLRFKKEGDLEQLWTDYQKTKEDAAAGFLQENLEEECGYPKEDEDNKLGNLALLPKDANSSLNDKLFIGKQREIVSWAVQGKESYYWAPPLTVAMFVKEVGSDEDKFKRYWSVPDREAFATMAKNMVDNYLQGIQQSKE